MAKTNTTRLNLVRWGSSGDTFTRSDMDSSHADLESKAAGFSQAGSRPTAGAAYTGFFHYSSTSGSVGQLSYCNGTAWFDIGKFGSAVAIDGTLADGSSTEAARADHKHSISSNTITTAMIQNDAVETAKINNLAVTTAKINDDAVTDAKLAPSGLDISRMTTGTLDVGTIGAGSILNVKLGSDINAGKIGDGFLSPDRIESGALSNAKLADMSANTVKIRQTSTGAPQNVEIGANQVLGRSGSGTLQSVQIAEDMIVNNAVTTAKMENVAAHGILARVASTTGDLSELTAGTNTVLNRGASGNLQFTSVTNAMLAGSITKDKITSVNASAVDGTLDAGNIGNDTVELGTKTTGNYVGSVAVSGSGLSISGSSGEGSTFTLSHANTSSVSNTSNGNNDVVQDLTFDTFGHVTGVTSYNLDNRYYTETEISNQFGGSATTGNRKVFGLAYNTNTRNAYVSNTIYIRSSAPSTGQQGDIWFDI